MSIEIPYEFTPYPKSFIDFILTADLTKNEIKVLLAIGSEVFNWPDSRESLVKKIACRPIADKINNTSGNVCNALKKLATRNIIKYHYKSKVPGKGSKIQLHSELVDYK